MSDWCILRTSGRNTLGLADSLRHGGYEAWTPVEKVRVSRKRGKVNAPAMPTWVFAKTQHLLDLIELADMPRKQQPDFSVFHYRDRIPLVKDDALAPLRKYQQTSEERHQLEQRKASARKFRKGDDVKITEGAFAGLSGIVERGGGEYSVVLFGNVEISVANFWLHDAKEAA